MNGAGKKLWGYYPISGAWVPLQVDANGKVVVDLSAVNLNDLGDLNVPTPADDTFLYWDDTAGEWKAKAISLPSDILTTQGDIITRNASAPKRLALGTAGHFLKAGASEPEWAAPAAADISCKVTHSGGQTCSDSGMTILHFDTEIFDTDAIHDNVTNNERLTCNTAGKYLVIGQIYFESNAIGWREISILKNAGYARWAVNTVVAVDGAGTAFNIMTFMNLAVGDYIRLLATQNSGGDLDVTRVLYYSPYFIISKIA